MEKQRERYLLEDILIVLFKHKYKILVAFFTVMIAVTIKTATTKPVYETQASLMVRSGRESISRSEVGDDPDRVDLGLNALVSTEAQILTSSDLIEEVISELGVENIYPDMVGPTPKGPAPVNEATIKNATFRFKGGLSANPAKGSNVIKVSFKHNDPQLAAQAVNQLIESFKVKHIEIFRNPRTSFMESQLAIYRQRLQESEDNLEAFKQKNQVFSLDQQRRLLLEQQVALDTSLKETQSIIPGLQQKISSLASQMQTIPKYELVAQHTGKSKNILTAQNQLLDLKMAEQKLLAKYTERNRQVTNVRKEIELIKDYLEQNGFKTTSESTSLSKNKLYENLEASLLKTKTDLDSDEARFTAIEQQLNQVNGKLQYLDAQEKELRTLERELDSNEENFTNYLTKLEDARMEEELDLMRKVNISVIQQATVPLSPIAPNKRFNLLVGIILGLGSGLTLAIFSEYCTGQGVVTPEGVEQHLGMPVLASVPYKENGNSPVIFRMVTIASMCFLLLLLNACSTTVKSPTPFNPRIVQEPSDSIEEYEIHAGDKLDIKFFYNSELNETVSVRPDGRISLQLANDVMAAGLTPAELTDSLTEKYSTELVNPVLTVIVRTYEGRRAYVDGEVTKSQMIQLVGDVTVSQSIAQSGGLKDSAQRNEVLVIRRKADKKPLVIPVNLAQVMNGTDINQDIVLQPYDIVYVPKSAIANVNTWAQQYIYNNFHIGFGYSINKWFWE